ncbi:MAG: sodium-dependent bicarbonate transport family permease [Pseudomonadota bacterium]
MDIVIEIAVTLLHQFHQPTLAFLIGGMVLAALGSRFEITAPVYNFMVIVLLLKVGLSAGISVRQADLAELAVPAVLAVVCGIAIVLLGAVTLERRRNVARMDAMATAGLFGAVSASTLAAGMAVLEEDGIAYEGFIGALYPMMDIAALITAIVLARLSVARTVTVSSTAGDGTATLGSAQTRFKGLLSILMLIMGMEAWSRLSEMRKVAHVYILYGVSGPLVHGLIGFGAGVIAHELTGFSPGGVILLAVMAASSSDISGPPMLRGALPEANPSAYVGTSTGIGTPVAILSIPLSIMLAEMVMGR